MEAGELQKNQKKKTALKRTRVCFSVATYAAAILAIACLIGIVVCVLMLNFGSRSYEKDFLLYVLAGSFAGGATLFALATYLFSKLMTATAGKELDFRELLDGEESFFVGSGTLLSFGETGITLHGEEGAGKPVYIPYGETRYFSVCTRRCPKEKGNWCVGIELPVKYLSKNKEESGVVLVQADAKLGLYRAIEKHGLSLLGELPNEAGEKNAKFTLVKHFKLPNRKKRGAAFAMLAVSIVCLACGIALGICYSASVGALLGAIGFVFGLRAGLGFWKSRAIFGVYREGLYWRESSGADSFFLKWQDIDRVDAGEKNGYPVITLQCAYGSYSVPAAVGAYECVKEIQNEKCNAEK